MIQTQIGIKTKYQLFGVNKDTGEERVLSGVFGNVILTTGRNELANRDWFVSCHVGTSQTPPDKNQGGLLGFVAATSTIVEGSDQNGVEATYGWRRKRFRFDVGDAAANLNEVAIAYSETDGDCITRALTEDINGQQNTITPLEDEFLDAVIEVQYYWPIGDQTGSVDYNGVTYAYTLRAAETALQSAWATKIGTKIESTAVSTGDWVAYDDDIGTIAQSPSGVPYNSDGTSNYTNAYANNSYQIVFGMPAGPNGWNATTGKLLRSLRIKTTAGWWQVQFDNGGNGIPKTTGFTMNHQFILGWDEAP